MLGVEWHKLQSADHQSEHCISVINYHSEASAQCHDFCNCWVQGSGRRADTVHNIQLHYYPLLTLHYITLPYIMYLIVRQEHVLSYSLIKSEITRKISVYFSWQKSAKVQQRMKRAQDSLTQSHSSRLGLTKQLDQLSLTIKTLLFII